MKYYITSYRASERGYWEEATATTLRGAKLEATRKYGKGYHDAQLRVAIGDNIHSDRQIIATKPILSPRWWTAE